MDSEVDDFVIYGDPLPEIEDDEIPKKKCIRPEDQVVTDEKGRRRFHGAFTGGFSAGYYNTVGSVEGWNPVTFQSSRSNRVLIKEQQPEDFMDNEDLGQFGIAPRKIHATKNFKDKDLKEKPTKRAHSPHVEGPIPGIPPLKDLVIPNSETIGIRLLKKMGWKPGQGIGPRLTKKQKKKVGNKKLYGCSLPNEENEDSDDEYAAGFTFAPEDVEEVGYIPKTDVKGLGYVGLDKNPILGSHFSLFGSAPINIGTNKKLNIKGQAFGVGVYEEEDDDIYSHEDLSQYDFTLEMPKTSKRKETPKSLDSSSSLQLVEKMLEGFRISHTQRRRKHYPLPSLPQGFKPIHETTSSEINVQPTASKGLDRHVHNSTERSSMLGEKPIVSVFDLISSEDKKRLESIKQSLHSSSEAKTELVPVTISSEVLSSPKTEVKFKPFASDLAKQKRYEQFLCMLDTNTKDKFPSLQPSSMTEWEKVREREEFQKASQLYRPLAAGIASRFISATSSSTDIIVENSWEPKEKKSETMKAAEQKQFGRLTREKVAWHPDKILCKRFNIPDPYLDSSVSVPKQKKEKVSIFNFMHFVEKENEESKKESTEETDSIGKEIAIPANEEVEGAEQVTLLNTTIAENKETTEQIEEPLVRPPMDLFKAIFQSSDEDSDTSSDESESKTDNSKVSLFINDSQSAISISNVKDHVNNMNQSNPTFLSTNIKSRTESNKFPSVHGVFSNIDLDELCTSPKNQSNQETVIKTDELANENSTISNIPDENILYGPKLPPQVSYNGGDDKKCVKMSVKSPKKYKKHKKHKHKHKNKHKKSKGSSDSDKEDVQILHKLKKLSSRK